MSEKKEPKKTPQPIPNKPKPPSPKPPPKRKQPGHDTRPTPDRHVDPVEPWPRKK